MARRLKPVSRVSRGANITSAVLVTSEYYQPSMVDSFLFEEHLNATGEGKYYIHTSDICMLFNQRRLDKLTSQALIQHFNEKMLDKQINYNKEMYQQQLGDTWQFYNDSKQNQWDMWNATNEYNSASAQRQRLEAAGLNPQLLMSGNNVGTATATGGTSASSPSAQGINPPTATPYSADYSGIAQGVGAAIDAYNQIANSAADRKVKEAQANNLRIEGKYMAQQILVDMYSKYTNAKNDTERTAIAKFLSSFDADLKASQTALNNENIGLVRNQARIAATQSVIMDTQLQFLPMQLKYELIDTMADISVKIATAELTRKQAEHEVAKKAETIVRTAMAQQQYEFNTMNYEKHRGYGPCGQRDRVPFRAI